MFNNLLASFFGTIGLKESRSHVSTSPAPQMNERDNTTTRTISTTESAKYSFTQDITSLEERFGQLTQGKTIEVSLRSLLEICPRTRRKADAYRGLQKYCKEAHGTELRIVPNTKSHVS